MKLMQSRHRPHKPTLSAEMTEAPTVYDRSVLARTEATLRKIDELAVGGEGRTCRYQ